MNVAPPPPFDLFTHPINLNVGTIKGGDWPSTVPGVCVTEYRIALYPGVTIVDLKARIEATVAEATADQPGSAEVLYSGFASEGYDIADDHPLIGRWPRPSRASRARHLLWCPRRERRTRPCWATWRHPGGVLRPLRRAGAWGSRTGVPSVRGADGAGAGAVHP